MVVDPSEGLRDLVDAGLDPDEVLFRIVQPGFVNFAVEPPEAQSNGFQDQRLDVANGFGLNGPCASVAIKSIWVAEGADVDQLLAGFPANSGIAQFTVGAVRDLLTLAGEPCPQSVMPDPRDGSPWHAVMWDEKRAGHTKAVKRARAQVAEWFREPTAH
ncbi:hypothetical protein [Cellulomonas sp.]|uniref:hypothetical protein n=1 Tax=Cellulomonas sp. TaxID=40001 RepID=UPI003BAC4F6B